MKFQSGQGSSASGDSSNSTQYGQYSQQATWAQYAPGTYNYGNTQQSTPTTTSGSSQPATTKQLLQSDKLQRQFKVKINFIDTIVTIRCKFQG